MAQKTIKQSITINSTPEKVYLYLTEADRLARWFPSEAVTDPRVGGAYKFRFTKPDGTLDHERTGMFKRLKPGSTVEYDWNFGAGQTSVVFEISGNGTATTVSLVHAGFESGGNWDQAYAMHEEGWKMFLGNLKSVIDEGKDRRSEMFG